VSARSSVGDWIAFWDSEHSIYVNARHRDVHYRMIARDVCALLPADAAVLDYGCGEASHAELIAKSARRLILCEAAPSVCAMLASRFDRHPRIEVLSPAEVAALPADTLDVIVMHSVAQYLAPEELARLFKLFARLLGSNGILVVGDIIPPHVSALTDALALLRLSAGNGFFLAATAGLIRTFLSEYWQLRSRLGLRRYSEAQMLGKLADAGFSARRAPHNIGHNQARMTFLARHIA
jgi:SAM-dependent methyltransferase